MHRILLYAIVVALLYFAWDSRDGETLAHERLPGATVAARLEGAFQRDAAAAESTEAEARVTERLEARVDERLEAARGRVEVELPGEPEDSAEVVLEGAERWLESNFPEGGRTDESDAAELAASGTADFRGGASSARLLGQAGEAGAAEAEAAPGESSPIYVAALARIESLNGELPAWCGLLDLSLRPASGLDTPPLGGVSSRDALAPGDTAWICDDTGKLLARVEALDGVGLELDPTWPWSLRQRRLFWAEGGGATGMPAVQYRLYLEGSGFGPAWTGRLVLLRTLAPTHR